MLLPLFLLACSVSRPVLTGHVQPQQHTLLVIRDTLDETQAVTWRAASEVDWAQLDQALVRMRESGAVALTARRVRDCEQEQIDCFRRCWKRKPPSPIERGSPSHYSHCQNTCRDAYMDCLKLNEVDALEFNAMEDAIDWLKRHRQEILVGTIVTAAGAAFIVVSAGAGMLVLAPLVFMAEAESPWTGAMCEG
ncbi:hypothetical protein [Cystobacter ferrugineus]|uniref:hypothetical protein n=1 Tax=Cystobacter ferrugineus TaxID=83449 RepID=UPI001FEB2644|nr:hypothetical protein [Cystobacter ferrugineus]